MIFELYPLIDTMIAFYRLPRGSNRFNEYLGLLTGGTKNDMSVPIPHFNPMAKGHVLDQLIKLKSNGIEDLITSVIHNINETPTDKVDLSIKVSVALADDLHGSWTNKYSTDYSSKFDISGYYNRNFCPVVLYTSEEYSSQQLLRRIEESCFRVLYWQGRPHTLQEHIDQEIHVYKNCKSSSYLNPLNQWDLVNKYYQEHMRSSDHSRIFNFLYGDKASITLGYKHYGIEEMAGFRFCL